MASHKVLIVPVAQETAARAQLIGEDFPDVETIVKASEAAFAECDGVITPPVFDAVILLGRRN